MFEVDKVWHLILVIQIPYQTVSTDLKVLLDLLLTRQRMTLLGVVRYLFDALNLSLGIALELVMLHSCLSLVMELI